MRLTLSFLLLLLFQNIGFGQTHFNGDTHSIFRQSHPLGDSILKLTVRSGEKVQHHDLSWCKANQEIWYDTLPVPDSLQKTFVNLIKNNISSEAIKHMTLQSVSFYNNPPMDSAILEAYPEFKKFSCKFNGLIHFNDSIIFPLEIITNASGEIINSEDIPKNLVNEKSFRLWTPYEIYVKASADPYVKSEGQWNRGIELHYSNRLRLFYYEIQAKTDEEPVYTSDYIIYKNKYILLDASTGKVLWRTTGNYYVGHQDCPKPYMVFPNNTLRD